MRIIAGTHKGRKLLMPNFEGLRPTADLVKTSMFNLIRNCAGLKVLDICCGSGALGLEAISRGAECCYFVDNNKKSLELCKKNADFVVGQCYFVFKDGESAIKDFSLKNMQFDLIIMDAPYNLGLSEKFLKAINQFGILADGGMIIAETDEGEILQDNYDDFKLKDNRKYGRKRVQIYLKKS